MKFWHIAAAIFASLQSIFTHAAPTGLAVRDPRWNETHGPLQYFIVQAPSEDLGPIANAIAAAVNGIYVYSDGEDGYYYGDFFIGYTATAGYGGQIPTQLYFDPIVTSFNYTDYPDPLLNFIVKQQEGGETTLGTFDPVNEYWVNTGFSVLSSGEILLQGIPAPAGWTVCTNSYPINPTTTGTYYQLWFQHFGQNCAPVQLFVTNVAPAVEVTGLANYEDYLSSASPRL